MQRWTIEEMDKMSSLEFAKAILQERYERLAPASPLSNKLSKAIWDLKRLVDDEKENEGYFSFVVRIHRDDVAGIVGENAAAKFTDSMMDELADDLKDDYFNQLYGDSIEVLVTEKYLPQIDILEEPMYKIGDHVKVNIKNECYDSFKDKVLVVYDISRSVEDHQGYDEGIYPEPLYDLQDLDGNNIPCSLYEYELEPAED
jgi:hypothetical protein